MRLNNTPKKLSRHVMFLVFGALLLGTTSTLASDLNEHMSSTSGENSSSMTEKSQLSPGHRQIEGVIEDIQENSIRVDAGEAGELTPRYLNLNKPKSDEEFTKGDRLQIEVNAQNKVVQFKKIEAQSKEQNGNSPK